MLLHVFAKDFKKYIFLHKPFKMYHYLTFGNPPPQKKKKRKETKNPEINEYYILINKLKNS